MFILLNQNLNFRHLRIANTYKTLSKDGTTAEMEVRRRITRTQGLRKQPILMEKELEVVGAVVVVKAAKVAEGEDKV